MVSAMDVLRAPWRMEYIESPKSVSHETECIFCKYARETQDAENLILARGEKAFVILNRYPYSSGHLMVVPYRHEHRIEFLERDEYCEMFALAQNSVRVLRKAMNADGFNLGINLGKVAGAGIDAHLHLHVVPRWNGDINFMSVTAETKVLPEALGKTRERLLQTWVQLSSF